MLCVAQKMGMGEQLSFRTAPAKGPSGTVKMLVIADHGHAQVPSYAPPDLLQITILKECHASNHWHACCRSADDILYCSEGASLS